MTITAAVWRIACIVPTRWAEAFTEGVEPHCAAVSWFVPDDNCPEARIEGYLDTEPDHAALDAALKAVADALGVKAPAIDINWLPPRDWVAENRRAFEPFSVGRFFVHDSDHRGLQPRGSVGLEVDAGLAFGSGRHESTSGCLLALDGLSHRVFRRPLDMGCGSGILAVAVAKTRRLQVLAADVDAEAVRVTLANARINAVADHVRAFHGNGYKNREIRRRGPYDLIIANILAKPLCVMAKDLSRNLAPGGFAVLAGFVIEDGNRVYAAHRRGGLRLGRRINLRGWQCLVLRKP
ncbi:MAG: 50S ribosomal protein L11 methyltransferase [Alphaproteobacteria bacterium]|nr:50S ribosomal protein L11 methyltransferase [Alphaproteobacteria bacterium]